ncbi:MAG TPA: chromosomal replication initiator protein DnaA [Ktedonobacteraceae bacterium]|nr:chromosomal replication initiator protein DnaA [Ktedonobacteraceae bacterium]
MNAKQIWQTTIERLQTKVPPAVFTTWFQGTAALSFQDGVLVVGIPSTFMKAHLEGRFLDLIRSILVDVTGTAVEVRFVVTKEPIEKKPEPSSAPPLQKRAYRVTKNRLSPLRREKQQQATTLDMATPAKEAHQPARISSPLEMPELPAVEEEPVVSPPNGTGEDIPEQPEILEEAATPHLPSPIGGLLNPRYTFSSFIVGKSNQFAHAASLAVAENPGRIYNPLFFYGGVGLGKTHLLHAIGHFGEAAGLNVLYVTSEKFTNEIINAIRYQKTEEFRTKYRQIDILLVDDIQFIAGKESTEEEFFHTFNTLHDSYKQIVVTSDRPPKAIPSLQDRLRSRFEWGLLADVQAPAYEHRLAILRSKAESLRFTIPNSVIEFVARLESSSVRELEGALNRVIAYATLHDAPLSVSLASQSLQHIYNNQKPVQSLTVTEVMEGVCRFYNVEPERLRGKQRDREIVWPRQVAMYVMREETAASLLQIGAELGGRDHTTIIHGWEKVQSEIKGNERISREIASLIEEIQRH